VNTLAFVYKVFHNEGDWNLEWYTPACKVGVSIVDHLSDFEVDHKEYEASKILPCKKIGNMGNANFSKFFSPNWNYYDFWEAKSCSDQ